MTGGSSPPTSPFVRAARLGTLLAVLTARAAATEVRGRFDADPEPRRRTARQRNADALRGCLGDLKGGALKAGQLLSAVDSLFPPDPDRTWTQALTELQEDNPALAWRDVEPLLVRSFGRRWDERFADFDPEPVAAASLGQVYRATWHDGRPVAVKVQYPFARAALLGDLRVLAAGLRIASVVAPGLLAAPVVAELRLRARQELDYSHEARAQHAVAAAFRDNPDVVVPDVVAVRDGVLVTEWLEGRPLVRAASDPIVARTAVAERYQRFSLQCPALSGWLHADPHPGNFRVTGDGRLGVVDFGAVVPMPTGLPPAFGRLVRIFADGGSDAEVTAALRAAGLLRPHRTLDVASLAAVMAPFGEPAREERFSFSPQWLRACFARDPAARDPDYTVALGLAVPAEHLMTQRVWIGVIGVLCRLDVTIAVRPVLDELLPGFR